MSKAAIATAIQESAEIPAAAAQRAAASVLEAISKGLKVDGKFAVTGFGIFEVKNTRARTGRNPSTGLPIEVPAGKRIAFRPAAALKEAMT
jgi:DNA-binding protein HU-beta